MMRSAIVFLVLLRLAIGWHFFYEGMLKVRSTWIGPTTTNRPFTSAGYFREAPGPVGKGWRWAVGDPDQEALAHVAVKPLGEKDDPASDKPQQRMPPALEREWDDYLKRFTEKYLLDNVQTEQAQAKLDQAKAKVVDWLTYRAPVKNEDQQKDPKYALFTTEQKHTYSSGEVKRRMSMAERIDEYRTKLAQLHDVSQKLWVMGKDVEGARLTAAKSEIAGLRSGLLRDLDEQTQEMKSSLDSVLTPKQKALGSVPAQEGSLLVGWVDFLTQWGLLAIGGCLLIGFLTRLSAWLGAGFLLMTILAMPSVPWLPAAPINEGSYLFVNKNVVEMLALCVLATTFTGRWFGVDGILYHGWRWITGRGQESGVRSQ
jgi:uncharacterized membrane protein YphA (DoxX/SURF4 family)